MKYVSRSEAERVNDTVSSLRLTSSSEKGPGPLIPEVRPDVKSKWVGPMFKKYGNSIDLRTSYQNNALLYSCTHQPDFPPINVTEKFKPPLKEYRVRDKTKELCKHDFYNIAPTLPIFPQPPPFKVTYKKKVEPRYLKSAGF